jgi:hypothetical protein
VSAIKAAMWAAPVLSLVALVAVRGRRLSAEEGAMLLFTLAYVVPYLVTGIMERYRIPIVPTVAVVLALLVWTAMEGWWGHKTGKTQ